MESRGVTLPELVIWLLLLGMAAQATLGPARRQADALIVRGAREELIAVLHRARMEARAHGEATVRMETGFDPFFVPPGGGAPVRVPLSDRGVMLEVAGARSAVDVGFGPMGTSQFAAATLVLRRRDAETLVVISGYGRVRRESR